jgi:hypothetical protein
MGRAHPPLRRWVDWESAGGPVAEGTLLTTPRQHDTIRARSTPLTTGDAPGGQDGEEAT